MAERTYQHGQLEWYADHVVSFYTFSKTFAMCGYRVEYAVGPRNLIEAMTKTHIYTTLCAPTISQMDLCRCIVYSYQIY